MKKIIVFLSVVMVTLSYFTVSVYAASEKGPKKDPNQSTSSQPPAPSPTTDPAVSPSPVQPSPAPVVSPSPAPVQDTTSTQPQQPIVTPTPVAGSTSNDFPQKGGGPKNDTPAGNDNSQNPTTDTSTTQTLQDVPVVTSDAPVELSVNAVPAPFIDQAPQDLPAPDPADSSVSTPQPKPTQVKKQPITAIIHAPIDLLSGGDRQYYKSSQLSRPMTNNLLGLGAFLILMSLFLLRPKIIWGRFSGIDYLKPSKDKGFPLPDRDIIRLNDMDISSNEENVIFHRLSF